MTWLFVQEKLKDKCKRTWESKRNAMIKKASKILQNAKKIASHPVPTYVSTYPQ